MKYFRKSLIAALFGCLAVLPACVAVPEGATATNQAVTTGLNRLMEQHKETAKALAESARQSVYQAWDNDILDRVIADELKRAGTATLTADQAATAAATAADIREALIMRINAHEVVLLAQIDSNYQGVAAINKVVTGYLASAEKVRDARDQLSDTLLRAAGISKEDIPGPVKDLLAISKSPEGPE